MAYLFKIEGKLVVPTEEALLIPPFKDIWERDKNKGKEVAMKEFSFIEFMVSKLATNPYKGYSDDVRAQVIIKEIFKEEKTWSPDKLVTEGIERFEKFQKDASPTYSLYISAIKSKNTLEKFLTTVDLSKINFKTGNPVYKPKELTSAMLDLDKITASLSALQKKVEEELFDAIKTKGQKEISPFAKVDSL